MNTDSQHPLAALGIKIEESNAEPLPRPKNANAGLLAAPRGGFFTTLGKAMASRLGTSLLAGAIITSCLNVDRVYAVIRFFGSMAAKLQDPEVTEKLGKFFGKGEDAAAKAEKQLHAPTETPRPNFIDGAANHAKKAAAQAGGKIADEFVEPVKKKADEAAATVKTGTERVINALNGGRTRPASGQSPKQQKGFLDRTGEQLAKYAFNQQPAPTQQNGYNAACPWCRTPLNLPDSLHKRRGCNKCLNSYLPADARRMVRR